jgi:hypothetical protein
VKKAAMDPRAVSLLTRRVLDACDWAALGAIYCHEDGERFWAERRPAVVDLGERLARALLRRVPARGASLWVGAGVAELPVLLAETLLHERIVVAANLREDECDVLNRALAAAAPAASLRFVAGDARTLGGETPFDHLGCISVFTDPETWPVLSDVAYGRIAPVQLDVENFVAERERARELARGLWARVRRPGLVTTSAEEVPWFLEQAAASGAVVDTDDELIDTAVVGDPVGFLVVR